jgi:hypothetical protein
VCVELNVAGPLGARDPDICCEMPETLSGAGASGSGDPAQGTQATD